MLLLAIVYVSRHGILISQQFTLNISNNTIVASVSLPNWLLV